MPSQQISFKNSINLNISGTLSIPEQSQGMIPVTVFAPGIENSRESTIIRSVSRALLNCGVASLLLDFTGHGKSEGTISDSTITQQVDDLQNAISWLRADGRFNPINLYGETTGATVVLRVAAADSNIRAIVLKTPRADTDLSLLGLITTPTLIIQGSADLAVRAESRKIYDGLAGKKNLHIIAGAGHLFDEGEEYLREAIEVTMNWIVDNLRQARRHRA
jgi:alpha/beta superfamily hydrolase